MSFPLVIRATASLEERELDRAQSRLGEDEFRAFYERTARPLWAYLSRLTGDRQRADDLLQEAYYRFYRAGARHESETHRRRSLFQIATNLVRDEARRGRGRQEVPLREEGAGSGGEAGGEGGGGGGRCGGRGAGALPRSTAPVPERQAEIRTDLGRAMMRLEPAQRELLWLAYAQGASHQEIAEVLGLRTVSVRTLLLRARRKLVTVLSGGGDKGTQCTKGSREAGATEADR